MQRRITSKSDFRTIDKKHARVAKRRTARISNFGSRQESKLHEAPGIPIGKVDTVHDAALAQPQFG
jgi:hypothetical protein